MYDLLLRALLASPPDHPTLLHLVRTWPPGLYSMPALTDAVVGRVKRAPPAAAVPAASAAAAGGAAGQQAAAGETRELWLLLSHLYERQVGHPLVVLPVCYACVPAVIGHLRLAFGLQSCGALTAATLTFILPTAQPFLTACEKQVLGTPNPHNSCCSYTHCPSIPPSLPC